MQISKSQAKRYSGDDMGITHKKVVTKPQNPAFEVSKDEWNDAHDATGLDAATLEGSNKATVQDHTPKAHTLASHTTKAHNELTGVGADDHHASGNVKDYTLGVKTGIKAGTNITITDDAGYAKIAASVGITTNDVTSSRVLGTIYQNTTGNPIWVNSFWVNWEDDMAYCQLEISPNSDMSGSVAIAKCIIGGGEYTYRDSVCGHVPTSYYYRIHQTAGYWPPEILHWVEQTLGG